VPRDYPTHPECPKCSRLEKSFRVGTNDAQVGYVLAVYDCEQAKVAAFADVGTIAYGRATTGV
jgi:hypothetical protein